jgi:hypothetical protein
MLLDKMGADLSFSHSQEGNGFRAIVRVKGELS